jgi:preprotein translocase subunit Sec63
MLRRCALRSALLALLLAAASAGKDLYNVLGIARGADEATIKKNYHKLALCVARGRRCWACA